MIFLVLGLFFFLRYTQVFPCTTLKPSLALRLTFPLHKGKGLPNARKPLCIVQGNYYKITREIHSLVSLRKYLLNDIHLIQ